MTIAKCGTVYYCYIVWDFDGNHGTVVVNTPFEIEVMRGGTQKLVKMQAANASSNAFNAIVETNRTSKRSCEGPIANIPQ